MSVIGRTLVSLTGLLRVRHARAETAKGDLAGTTYRRRSMAEQLSHRRRQLADVDIDGAEADFSVLVARRASLAAAVSAANSAVAAATVAEERAQVEYSEARRAERVVEKLVERAEAARRLAAARAEQAALDEVAAMAHERAARASRRTAHDADPEGAR